MTRREAVARAIFESSAPPGGDWNVLPAATQAAFLCYADYALAANAAFVDSAPEPEPDFVEEDEFDRQQDFYELQGLR